MPGVGEQRDRSGPQPGGSLRNDIDEVKRDPDREGAIPGGGRGVVMMIVAVAMRMSVPVAVPGRSSKS